MSRKINFEYRSIVFCQFKLKNEHAFVAEIAMQAKSESILDPPAVWMFDAYSPPLKDSTFKPLRAGINPAPSHEAHPKK
jgi:hypothetical protein